MGGKEGRDLQSSVRAVSSAQLFYLVEGMSWDVRENGLHNVEALEHNNIFNAVEQFRQALF